MPEFSIIRRTRYYETGLLDRLNCKVLKGDIVKTKSLEANITVCLSQTFSIFSQETFARIGDGWVPSLPCHIKFGDK